MHIYMTAYFPGLIGTGTSIKSCDVKLIYEPKFIDLWNSSHQFSTGKF
jgi:hypothetical protein